MTVSSLRDLLIGALLAATFALPAPVAQAQDIEFGTGLRSIDFAAIFDRSAPARAEMWDKFYTSGIRTIVISQSLIAPFAPDRSRRAAGTYLTEAELSRLRDTLDRGPATSDDFHVTYIGGYGLGASVCDASGDAENRARNAADWEYHTIARRLLDKGVPIRAIDIDGPFLRLIGGSQKDFSCARESAGSGLSETLTAQITMVYMKRLRDLIGAHPTNARAGLTPEMSLLINLPNWRLGGAAALSASGSGRDLGTVLAAFGSAMEADADTRNSPPLKLNGAVIDYPFHHARNDLESFKAKTAGLLQALQQLPRTRARLTYITNTRYNLHPNETEARRRGYEGTVDCVWSDNWKISGGSLPYLPYQNARGEKMPQDCVAKQNDADERYFSQSAAYARNIASGAWRSKAVPIENVAAYRFMSWHEMPVSSLATMNRVLRYKLYGE